MNLGELVETGLDKSSKMRYYIDVLKNVYMFRGKVVYTINRDNVIECCGQLIAKFDPRNVSKM